ncbi:MAG: AEC family transporter [Oceanospirillaceae bacterium]|nr:AEC family transporter [Oceanospirillaceae bacterium]
MLSTLIDPILPIFTILLLGFIAFRTKAFDVPAAQIINKFVFYLATPALVFNVISNAPIEQLDYRALGVYFSAQLIAYMGLFALLHYFFNIDKKEALLLALTSVFVNHIFFVLPIAERVYGPIAARPIAGVVIIDILVLFCGTVLALDLINSTQKSVFNTFKLLCKNPFLIASFLGALTWLVKDSMPSGLLTYATFVGAAAAPASLFSLGVILASNPLGNVGRATWLVVAVNVVLMPILVYAFIQGVDVSPQWSKIILLMSAGPCGAMPFVIALQYGIPTRRIAKAILISTLLSLVSITYLTS